MADKEAENFLNKLQLDHLIERFREAGAKKEDFRYLRENLTELMNLVPLLRERRIFVEAFDAEQACSSAPRPSVTTRSDAPVSIRANLEAICLSSDKGKIFWAKKDKHFDQAERDLLAEVITKYFYDAGDGSINKAMFLEMVKIIKLQFPAENPHTWYVPATKGLNSKPIGRLYSSYRTLQEHRRQEVGPQKGAKLRLNTIPFNLSNDIFECWDECFPIRRHEIMSECFDMNEYNVLYNFGKANELISRDFSRVNDKFVHISTKLPVFINKFKRLFDGYRKNFKDDPKLSDEIVRTFNANVAANDHSIFLAFYSLPLILRENFVTCNEKRFRPTIHMTREAFITLIPTEATLAEKRKRKKEDAISRMVTIQPYIIAVGTVACILRYFVVFDELIVPCQTCMEAIDLHYKMHDTFNLQYAAECRSVLIFVQKYFYALHYDGDFPVPHVETLISDIEK